MMGFPKFDGFEFPRSGFIATIVLGDNRLWLQCTKLSRVGNVDKWWILGFCSLMFCWLDCTSGGKFFPSEVCTTKGTVFKVDLSLYTSSSLAWLNFKGIARWLWFWMISSLDNSFLQHTVFTWWISFCCAFLVFVFT